MTFSTLIYATRGIANNHRRSCWLTLATSTKGCKRPEAKSSTLHQATKFTPKSKAPVFVSLISKAESLPGLMSRPKLSLHQRCPRPHRLWTRKQRLTVGQQTRFCKTLTTEGLAATTGSAKPKSAAMVYVRVCRVATDVIIMRTASLGIFARLVCTGRGKMSARPTARQVIVVNKTTIAAQRTSAGLPPRMKRRIIKRLASSCTHVKLEQCSVGRWKVLVRRLQTTYRMESSAIQELQSKSVQTKQSV